MRDPKFARKAVHFLVLLVFLQSILVVFSQGPASGQEPEVVDIGGGRRKATWELDDAGNYTLENVTLQGGSANLSLDSFSWIEHEQSDFLDGTWDDNITITPDGNLTLRSDDTNLVHNGDFSSSLNWTFLNGSGNNVIGEWDGQSNNAHLHHYGASGPSLLFDGLDIPANITNWTPTGAGAARYYNNSGHDSPGSMEIGWKPIPSTDTGGARRTTPTFWDWSQFNRLSLWIATSYNGTDLEVYLNLIDTAMLSWDSPRMKVNGNWKNYVFDLEECTSAVDITEIKALTVIFTGLSGDGIYEWRATIDEILLYKVKILDETSYVNQSFVKSNLTSADLGSVLLSFDVIVEECQNIEESILALSVSNASDNYTWEMGLVTPPYSDRLIADLSWLMTGFGSYNVSLKLRISLNTTLESNYSARFDNISIVAPNRGNGTYVSEPYDTTSQSLWRNVSWIGGPPGPETSISILTRTGNSSNTSDGSWSSWEQPQVPNLIASPPNRYVQYRVDLTTDNASKGPVVSEVMIDYEQYFNRGTVETEDLFVPDLHMWEEFWTKDTVVPGTELSYYYSSDGGGIWSQVVNGFSLSFVTNKTLRFKSEMKSFNTTLTPTLFEMNLTYQYVGDLDHIHMSNDTVFTVAGSVVSLSAWGEDIFHRNVSFDQKWDTTDPVGSVSQSGDYTAGMAGTWRVFCNNTDGSISNFTVVNVAIGSLYRIGIDPWDPGTVLAGDQVQFNAVGYDVMDNLIPVSPNWSVIGEIGDIDPGPNETSVFNATTVGIGRVSITDGLGHTNETNSFSVIASQLASIEVSPSPANLLPGESAPFNATGHDAYGNNVTLTSTLWETDVGEITSWNSTTANFTAQLAEFAGGYIRATQDSIWGEAVINIDDNDEPPQIQGIVPDQERIEDFGFWTLNLTNYADDAEDDITVLRWRITGDDSSLYTITGEDIPGNHLLTFSTKQDAFGNDEITLWLIDSLDQTAHQSIWVNITSVNDRPVISAPTKVYVRFDVPLTIDYSSYIYDVDNSISELVLTTDDSEHTGVNGLQVTYEYPESMIGEPIFVILNVSDGMDYTQHVVEVVVSSNYPPRLLTPIADIVMNEDEPLENVFDMDDHFEDPDDSQLTYSALSQKVTIDIDSNGMVSLNPEENWFGDELVVFIAKDSSGAIVQDVVLVSVLPMNDPPVIDGLPDIAIHYGVTYDFDVKPYISDIDNLTSELTISCSDTSNSTILGRIISFRYDAMATVVVTLTVSDGESQDSDVMIITVTDNHPPVFNALPDVFFNEDESLPSAFSLDDYFSDPEGDTLTYNVSQSQYFVHVVVGVDTTVTFSSDENWSGQQVIVFRAEDEEGAFVEDSIIVTVVPVNDAPVISPVPKQVGEKSKAWLLDLSEYIYDSDNSTDELVIHADFEYVTVAGHYLIFNCEESFNLRTITATVSDGLLQDSRNISVSVSSYVNPQVEMYIWPTSICVVLLGLFGLLYWRASRKYVMEDLFVVKRDGKPLVHKTIRVRPDRDEDMFSGMMTAIHAFAEDTFREEGQTLKSFESEEKRVVLEAARNFYVAAIFAGKEPKWATKSLEDFVDDVETLYGQTIKSWSGLMDDLEDLPDMVAFFIRKRKYSAGDWTPAQVESEDNDED